MNSKIHSIDQKMILDLVTILFIFEVCMSVHAVVSDTESEIVEWISRRQSSDIYYFINSSTNRGNKNTTYLINENRCVMNQELFRDIFI